MTFRQRQASGSASAAVSFANGNESGLAPSSPFSWEDWCRRASAHQRDDALGLARQQGLLYPYQLSHLANGAKPAESAAPDGTLVHTLSRLASGKSETLPNFALQTVTFFDAELDEPQQQAVKRAISTPDLFLLQGLPGTGKSRVLAEIILQAVVRGWRVLFLGSHAVSVDIVLQKLVGRQEVFPIRYLEATEKPGLLPAWLRGVILEEQQKAFQERILTGARDNREQVESRCQRRHAEEPIWAELRVCLDRTNALERRLGDLQGRTLQLPSFVESEAQGRDAETLFAAQMAERRLSQELTLQKLDATIQSHVATLAAVEQEIAELSGRITALEPGYRAKKDKRFWTWAFWQHLLNGQILQEMETLQTQLAGARTRQQALAPEVTGLQKCRQQRQYQFDAEQTALVQDETRTRQQVLTQEMQALEQERSQLSERWNILSRQLAVPPAEPTLTAFESAKQSWQQHRQHDEETCLFAKKWSGFVEEASPQLTARLPMLANVLAGTWAGWRTESRFQEAANASFDLLLIEDADTLTESDLLRAARQVQRCVLVGQFLTESTPAPKSAEKPSRSFAALPLASALCWPRLWQSLSGDAGLWPYTWFREQGRLVCQRFPLSKEDRQDLHCEGLADAAEIELRILHHPKATPCLAQLVFPPHWTFQEAFAFIISETQEIPLQPLSRSSWWREDVQRWSWFVSPSSAHIHTWLDLEPGVRLGTINNEHGDAARLARIEFDKALGWDQPKAEAWLARYRPAHDHGRTFFLQTPYRFATPLASKIVTFICADEWFASSLPSSLASPTMFEFCAIPSCDHHDWPKDGAGFELDLSASRHVDRLPAELRQGLPTRGYVNYLEAQALVRRLESLVREGDSGIGSSTRIAVLALYESQVILLRRMIADSEILRSRSFSLEVSLPSQMHQRECDVVLLSLTRSHIHRCGAFGADARELPLAMTRARTRLIVFGDVGMLCKRIHWHGPLDHLDAHSSHQEFLRLSRIFACVEQQAKSRLPLNGLANA
jgi:hypothetical protein